MKRGGVIGVVLENGYGLENGYDEVCPVSRLTMIDDISRILGRGQTLGHSRTRTSTIPPIPTLQYSDTPMLRSPFILPPFFAQGARNDGLLLGPVLAARSFP